MVGSLLHADVVFLFTIMGRMYGCLARAVRYHLPPPLDTSVTKAVHADLTGRTPSRDPGQAYHTSTSDRG